MMATGSETTATPKAPRATSSSTGGAAKSGRTISLQNCVGLVSPDKKHPNVYKMLFIQGE